MKIWYVYYRVLHAIWKHNSVRVELEDILNFMLEWSRGSLLRPHSFRPTTLELHEFMNHMAANDLAVFKQHELAHLMEMENWN